MKFLIVTGILLGICSLLNAEVIALKAGRTLTANKVIVYSDHIRISTQFGFLDIRKSDLASATHNKFYPTTQATSVQPKNITALLTQAKDPGGLDQAIPTKTPLPVGLSPEVYLPDIITVPNQELKVNYSVRNVEFTIRNSKKTFVVQAMLPEDKAGTIPNSASSMIYYGHHNPTGALFHGKLSKIDPTNEPQIQIFKQLVEEYGISVFTVLFDYSGQDINNEELCYYYKQSGAFDAINAARARLLNQFRLSKIPMVVLGESGGATQVEQYAMSNPSEVAAAVILSGAHYADPPLKLSFPLLVAHTRGDPRAAENEEFVKNTRLAGANVLYYVTRLASTNKSGFKNRTYPQFHHGRSAENLTLGKEFIIGMLSIGNGSFLRRDLSTWPYVTSTKIAGNQVSPNPNPKIVDTRNLAYLPSKRFVDFYKALSIKRVIVECDLPSNRKTSVGVRVFYPSGKANSVALLLTDSITPLIEREDLAEYISAQGYIAVNVEYIGSEVDQLSVTRSIISWMQGQPFAHNKLLLFLGVGRGGSHLLLATTSVKEPSRAALFTFESPLSWPFAELSPVSNISSLAITPQICFSSSGGIEEKKEALEYAKFGKQHNRDILVSEIPTTENIANFDFVDCALQNKESYFGVKQ